MLIIINIIIYKSVLVFKKSNKMSENKFVLLIITRFINFH